MTELPWDRFPPTEGQGTLPAEPEVPYVPPAPVVPPSPRPQPGPAQPPPRTEPVPIDFGAIISESVQEALERAGPVLKQQAMDYAKDAIHATLRGQQVDHAHPTVTAETAAGRELVVADAKSRSKRTLVQGLIIDVVAALAAVLATAAHMDLLAEGAWVTVGALLIKTLIQTVMAYVMRLRVTPTITTQGTKLALMPIPRPMAKTEGDSP